MAGGRAQSTCLKWVRLLTQSSAPQKKRSKMLKNKFISRQMQDSYTGDCKTLLRSVKMQSEIEQLSIVFG